MSGFETVFARPVTAARPTGRVYWDHAATSPLRPEAAAAMAPWWGQSFGNAASAHAEGRAAKRAVSEARAQVADLVGARPEEVVFTGGATEASNLAIRGAAHARRNGGKRVASSVLEHAASREAVAQLAIEGWHVTLLEADGEGVVQLPERLAFGTAVLSVIAGHNELGTIQPLQALAEAAHRVGALLHLDAVQTAGYVDLAGIEWDLLSLSAHKLGGPQGVGALVRRRRETISPLIVGGSQEGGLRPGTVPTALVAGFGAAAAAAQAHRATEATRLAALRELVAHRLLGRLAGVRRLGPASAAQALPHVLSLGVPGFAGDELVYALDRAGVAASSSSACLSGARSPVLDAIGLSDELALLRLSLGWSSDLEDVEGAIEAIAGAIAKLAAQTPFERRAGLFARQAEDAGVTLTGAHWEAAEGLFAYHQREGVLPGARALAKQVPYGESMSELFPYGLSTLAVWLGLPVPQGGCRPYAG